MIRFVCGPDGRAVPDVAAKLPGRGAWVTASAPCLKQAQAKGLLARALGTGAERPDLSALVEKLLLQRCLELLSMGRRSGLVLGGGGKIREAGRVKGILVATDASSREARALAGDVPHDWRIDFFTGEELGSVFGRESIAFAAVGQHPFALAERIAAACQRLAGFRQNVNED